MTDQPSNRTRRSVLRTAATGGAATLGLGMVGPVSAGHFSAGDCAVTNTSVGTWERGCPLENRVGGLDEGTYGQVIDTCTTDDGDERVLFSPGTTIRPANWVVAHALDPC